MKSIALDIKSAFTGWDNSGPLTVFVGGVPAGASLSAGTLCFDGCWQLRGQDLDGLRFTPPAENNADIYLDVRAASTEIVNGSEVESVQTLRLKVEMPKGESLDFTLPDGSTLFDLCAATAR